jgi:alcohol dehydrogenase YqhD (iron-dependent ADH family)
LSKYERELFEIVNENDNPGQAVVTAINVFAAFLEQLEADQELQLVDLQESS